MHTEEEEKWFVTNVVSTTGWVVAAAAATKHWTFVHETRAGTISGTGRGYSRGSGRACVRCCSVKGSLAPLCGRIPLFFLHSSWMASSTCGQTWTRCPYLWKIVATVRAVSVISAMPAIGLGPSYSDGVCAGRGWWLWDADAAKKKNACGQI